MLGQNAGNVESWADVRARRTHRVQQCMCIAHDGEAQVGSLRLANRLRESEEAHRDNICFIVNVKNLETVATLLGDSGFKEPVISSYQSLGHR